jgi:hypothetical protein
MLDPKADATLSQSNESIGPRSHVLPSYWTAVLPSYWTAVQPPIAPENNAAAAP